MKTIGTYELIDHGIDHANYFQGCGVSHTSFDYVVTGCGENAKEAFEDALEQIAQDGYDVSTLEESEPDYQSEKAENASVTNYFAKRGEEPAEDCELYYYLSIRWNEGTYTGIIDGLRGTSLEMTREQALGASHQGDCYEDAKALTKDPAIAKRLDAIGAETLRLALKESGGWDSEELSDNEENRVRAVWMAACDVKMMLAAQDMLAEHLESKSKRENK